MGTTFTKKRSTGISGTSAAFIDVSFVLVIALLFSIAALKTNAPERVNIDPTIAAQGAEAPTEPLAMLKVYESGIVVNGAAPVPLDQLAQAMVPFAGQDGYIGLCVAEAVPYQMVRNAIAAVQAEIGVHQWTDCGGGLE